MRPLVLLVATLLLAGCTGTPHQTPAPSHAMGSGGPTPASDLAECKATPNGTAHATPQSSISTQTVPTEKIAVTVAHRDGVARYDTDGTEEVAASPSATLPLEFAPGLGYRLTADGSAVYDQRGIHRFDGNLKRTASWNATAFSGAVHGIGHYYATANGRLHVLSEALSPVHDQALPNWTAPAEPRYDVIQTHLDLLWVGSNGDPDVLHVYRVADRASPALLTSIKLPRSSVPIGDANLGTQSTDSSARATPWTDSFFSHLVVTPDAILVWRDGAYQGNSAQTVSRFQDFVSIRRSNLSVEHLEQQYLEDNHYGWTQGAHIGPVDEHAQWTLLHIRGAFSLAYLVQSSPRVFPACHVDLQMSSFSPEDAFFHRAKTKVLLGTQTRIEAWDVKAEPGKIAEAKLPKPATDARWT